MSFARGMRSAAVLAVAALVVGGAAGSVPCLAAAFFSRLCHPHGQAAGTMHGHAHAAGRVARAAAAEHRHVPRGIASASGIDCAMAPSRSGGHAAERRGRAVRPGGHGAHQAACLEAVARSCCEGGGICHVRAVSLTQPSAVPFAIAALSVRSHPLPVLPPERRAEAFTAGVTAPGPPTYLRNASLLI